MVNLYKKGSVFVIELDENMRALQALKAKLESIGESL
jgi:hypothetical protein